MCVIIDACVRDLVFGDRPHEDALPVLQWIESPDGRMVYGGKKQCDELFRSERAKRRVRGWKQAGRAFEFPPASVDAEQAKVNALGVAASNDTHIIALARISGARVLYSTDTALHKDFKNAQLVDQPRGSVYQRAEHASLLSHTASCRSSLAKLND